MLIFHGIVEEVLVFIMQNTRNFNYLYIVIFEVSSKYVILKCHLIKALVHRHLTFANA